MLYVGNTRCKIATSNGGTATLRDSSLIDKIMTSKSNAPVMQICYAQGWAANPNYMTRQEAAAVTSVGTVFKNKTNITHFEEFQYFTGIKTLVADAFRGCSNLTTIIINPLTFSGNYIFEGCKKLTYIHLPAGTIFSGGANYTFANCNTLTTICWDIPQYEYGKTYLQACTELRSNIYDVYDKCLYSSSNKLFKVPTKYKPLSFREGTTIIGAHAMSYNAMTGEYIVPEGITTIETYGMHHITGITSLTLPSTLTSTGVHALSYLNSVLTLTVNCMTAPTLGQYTLYSWGTATESVPRVLRIPTGAIGYTTGQWKTYLLDKGWTIEYFD